MNTNTIQELLAKVPAPLGESLPEGVTDSSIDSFIHRAGLRVPADLREWLQLTNGPCVGPGGLFGIRTARDYLDMEFHLQLHPSWKHKKWIPIAGDGCGNYYIMPTNQEYGPGFPVLFIDTIKSGELPAYIVASDVEHFLVFLLQRELGNKAWPFNEKLVTEADPRIRDFVGLPYPWRRP
jgi:hypothetical protein